MADNLVRVAAFRAEQARELLPLARENPHSPVGGACVRVRRAWLLGERVDRADIALIEEFSPSAK